MRFHRFSDLKEAGIVNDRATVRRWIQNEGFPAPKVMGPNTLAWEIDAVEAWIVARPTGAAPQGPKKRTARTAPAAQRHRFSLA